MRNEDGTFQVHRQYLCERSRNIKNIITIFHFTQLLYINRKNKQNLPEKSMLTMRRQLAQRPLLEGFRQLGRYCSLEIESLS
jgi:hypothetical protein